MKRMKFIKGLTFLALVFLSASLYAQENDTILLKGVTVDSKGQPLIGVNLVVKGSMVGTITDFDGNFELKVPEGASVVVSYDGFATFVIENVNFSNIKVYPSPFSEGSSIEFCCINHTKSHCGMTTKEMQKLSKRKKCLFK